MLAPHDLQVSTRESELAKLALDLQERALWLFDLESMRIVWANRAGLAAWRASDIDELCARDAGVSAATRARLADYERRFAAGHSVVDVWTFYPLGRPTTLRCCARGATLPSGHRGMLIEASPLAETELRSLDLRSAETLRHTSVLITLFSDAGAVLLQNPAAQRCFGPASDERNSFVGRFRDREVGQLILERLRAGESYFGEVEVVTQEGVRWHAIEGRRTLDPTSGELAIVVDQRDATERKMAEDAVGASERLFRVLCMQAPIGIFHTDAAGDCIFVNARWCDITGLAPHHALGSGWLHAVHPQDRERVDREWQTIIDSQAEGNLQFRYRHADGRDAWVSANAVPVRNVEGHVTGYVGAVSDLTRSVISEQRFALAFEQSKDAHMLLDDHGAIFDCNQSAVELFAAGSKERLRGLTPIALSPQVQTGGQPSSEGVRAVIEQAIRTGAHRFEWTHRRLDGGEFTAEVAVTCVSLDGKRAFFSTLHDSSERKRAEAAILRSREAALEASRVKSQFLANMSHEIRTPMNGVLGMLTLALGTELTAEQREYMSAAQGSAEGLLEIINDILDLSKIEAGKLSVERVHVDIDELLRGCLQTTSLRAHAKGIEFVVQVQPEVPEVVVGDPVRIRQVLTNLIGNAVKFTDVGHVMVAVSLRQEEQGSQLEFRVEDTGIGIDKVRQARIFDAFQQADNSTTRRYGGTGLGLTICKQLVSMMGGQLRLISAEGEGSTFAFSVPLEVAHTLRPHVPLPDLKGACVLVVDDHPDARGVLRETLETFGARVLSAATSTKAFALVHDVTSVQAAFVDHGLGNQDGIELPRLLRRFESCAHTRFILMRSAERVGRDSLNRAGFAFAVDKPLLPSDLQRALTAPLIQTAATSLHASLPQRQRALVAQRPVSVLIVEDHPVNAHFLSALLRRLGHAVVHASNGERALAAVAQQRFDIVLMDVQMPVMDGLEATRRIRAEEAAGGVRVPIVALTANAMKGDRDECLAAGMDAYIAKPIDPELLQQTLSRLTQQREATPVLHAAGVRTGESAVATEPQEEPPFARDALLQRACGDPRFEADLIRIFIDSQEEMMRDVDASVARRDSEALRNTAHRLKGALQLICARPAATLAQQLEHAGRAGQNEGVQALLEGLHREMRRLRSALGDVSRP